MHARPTPNSCGRSRRPLLTPSVLMLGSMWTCAALSGVAGPLEAADRPQADVSLIQHLRAVFPGFVAPVTVTREPHGADDAQADPESTPGGRHQPPDTFRTRIEGEWIPLLLPGRGGHQLVLDSEGRRVIVVGGASGSATWGDAWEITLEMPVAARRVTDTWSHRFGFEPAAVFDSKRGRLVVIGGVREGVVDGPPGYWRDDDGTVVAAELGSGRWAPLVIPSLYGAPPAPRHGHSAIYDPLRDRVLMFGGESYDDGRGWLGLPHSDLWELSLSGAAEWQPITAAGSAPNEALGDAAHDPTVDRMWYVAKGRVWSLDLDPGRWTEIEASGEIPARRGSIALDTAARRLYHFSLGEVHVLDLGTFVWSRLAVEAETPGTDSDLVWDPVGHRLLVFGGLRAGDSQATQNGPVVLWALAPDALEPAWQRVYDADPPSASLAQGVFDARRDRVIAFDRFRPRAEIHELKAGGPWRLLAAGAPGSPTYASVALDEARDRLVLEEQDASGLTTTYEFPLSQTVGWKRITSSTQAHLWRVGYDSGRQEVVRFGWSPDGVSLVERLAPIGTGEPWQPVTLEGEAPPPRYYPSVISDPEQARLFMIGGFPLQSGDDTWRDLWVLHLREPARWDRVPVGLDFSTDALPGMAYDPIRGLVVFSGLDLVCCGWRTDGVALPSTGEYWLSLPMTSMEPFVPRRRASGLVWDSIHDRLVAFGGQPRPPDGPGTFADAYALAFPKATRIVRVDVRPNGASDRVRPGVHATLQVAVLSDPGFDSRTVDLATVRVAGVPVRRGGDGQHVFNVRDVDHDDLEDIVLHFDGYDLPLTEANVLVKLWGRTFDDVPIEGLASVVVGSSGAKPAEAVGTAPVGEPAGSRFVVRAERTGTTLRFVCELAGHPGGRLEIFDVSGRRVASAAVPNLGAANRFELLVQRPAGGGLYFARLTGATTLHRKVLVLP